MIPFTCGRTSATKYADVRPGSSVVSVKRCGSTATTATSGTDACCWGTAAALLPQPAISALAIVTAAAVNPVLNLMFIEYLNF
jgi:hypothetical protein